MPPLTGGDRSRVIVETPSGRLRGRERHGVLSFRGIPYARPPVGPLRFRAPEPPPAWSGVRDAARFGGSAPQASAGRLFDLAIGAPESRQSEDCLTLNVWTPGLR